MTASRASRGAAALLSLALLAAGAGAHALAQGAPLELFHPNPPAPTPADQTQAGPVSTPAAGGSPGAAPAAPKGIEVNRLGGIDPDALGTLDPRQSGLGADLWGGVPRAVVARLVPAIPAALPSPTLRDLARRLLLASAVAPEGPKGEGPSLVSLRAQKLVEMGDTADLRALSDVIPRSFEDEALARTIIEARLIDNDTAGACAQIGQHIHRYQGTFWQKAQIFCQALDHQTQQVEMGIGLLHDEGEVDPAFYGLAETLIGAKGYKVESLAAATPLLLAMTRAAAAPIPPDVLRSPSPAMLRVVATSPNASAELRLAAAERAASLGALPFEALDEVYDQTPASDAELKDALSRAQAAYSPRARALLYRAAKSASQSTARAADISAALSLARTAGVYGLAVVANLPLVKTLPPSPELASFALEAGRALYYAGRADAAQDWLVLAERQASASAAAADAAAGLWPLARLAAPSPAPWDEHRFLAWRNTQRPQGEAAQPSDARAAERANRLLGLFSAAGEAVPDSAWQTLYPRGGAEPAAMPSQAIWHGLAAAAAAGRRGETVLLALVAAGADVPASANPIALDQVVESLRRVGFERESRQLAVEAAAAAGL